MEAGGVKRESLSASVAERIRRLIDGGEFKAGEMLPGERVFCARLGVSRTALREAMRTLSQARYVEVRHGRGTFVRARDAVQEHALDDWLSSHDDPVANLLEMRFLLEPGIARLAAQRAGAPGVAALRETIAAMRRHWEEGNLPDLIAADERFHYVLAQLTGNPVVVQLVGHMMIAIGGERKVTLATPEGIRVALRGHEEITEAIARGDAEAASALMQNHVREAQKFAQLHARDGAP